MVRTGMIALVVAASALAGCKGTSGSADKDKDKATAKTEEPVAKAEPRVPSGTVPVTLPELAAKQTRRVASAKTFVTIAKDGSIKQGKLAAGADPYAGAPHGDDALLEQELFGTAAAPPPPPPDTQDDPPPPPPPDEDDPPDRPQGQYHMRNDNIDPALTRQQAIDMARNAGILGSISLGAHAYGELDTAAGAVDTLVLADREATAFGVLGTLTQLAAHKTALAVDGGAAPDAVAYRFTTQPEAAPDQRTMIVVMTDSVVVVPHGANEPTSVARSPAPAPLDTAKIAAALRPSPMTPVTGVVTVEIQGEASAQDVIDLLGVLASVGAPTVEVSASPSGPDDVNIYGGLLGNEAGEMNGGFGFGRSGFGPGGGGTGSGTIGRIGSGTGYGVGGSGGGMRGHGAVPQVRIGSPTAVGDLDKAIIRRYIKRNIAKITYCYEKQLLAKPDIEGTVATQFYIGPEGHVMSSTASGVDPEVADCVAAVINDIEFPKPKGGGGVQVNYPFTFRRTGG